MRAPRPFPRSVLSLLAAIAVVGLAPQGAHAAAASVYVVGNATLPAGAVRVASLQAVPWSALPAGARVLVSPGTYAGVTTIIATGTQAAPIVVKAVDPAHMPVLTNSIDIQGSAWVQVWSMNIQSPAYSGIVVRNGSHHVTLSYNTISNAPTGINLTTGAGTGNRIVNNTIRNSATNGISVDYNASPTDRTLIAWNTIQASGMHGMEIHASHYQIEHNTVSGSGRLYPGTSGIHIYSASAQEDAGDDNIVRYNLTYNNLDASAYDGNGIQADQWCDHNTISFNVSWGNDGAGVLIYDGQYNLVEGNTLYANERDPGGEHAASGGEITIGSSGLKRSAYNVVRNNVIVSTHAVAPAFHLDSASLNNGNAVGPNLYYNTVAAGKLVRYGDGNLSQTLAQINAMSGTTGSVIAMPAFANVALPGSDGLKLTKPPGATGVFTSGAVDRVGQAAIPGWSLLGAYFTHP